MTWEEWNNSEALEILFDLVLTEYIPWEEMTENEKVENPDAERLNGYLKVYTYHEAWANLWKELNINDRRIILSLPNFDPEVFKDITGIDISQDSAYKRYILKQ